MIEFSTKFDIINIILDKNCFDMIKLYSPGYLRDLEYQHAYWKQFQGAAKDVVDKINDSYLKFNGETDGVKSYGRMVDLLLAYHRQGAL